MANADVPVACTLTPEMLVGRVSDFEDLFARHLVDWHREPTQVRLTLAVAPSAEETESALLAAERQCCSFLTFTTARQGENLVVRIASADGVDTTLDGFSEVAQHVMAHRRAGVGGVR